MATTDEVWRLQNGDDPECRHFRKIADVGHYRAHRSTRQGIYICTASGILLGSLNTHNVDAVIEMMNDSLKEYQAMDPAARKLAKDDDIRPSHRWEDSYPENGLSLTMYARDLPESCNPQDQAGPAWNQDRVWFSVEEAKQFLPPNRSDWQASREYELPQKLVTRLARFSVIDTVKGQTSYYAAKEVVGSEIVATINQVDENQVQLVFEGATVAESPVSRGRRFPHGIQTKLRGTATWDRNQMKFTGFEMVALGARRGRTVFNGRHDQLEETPVGFVFRLTPTDAPLIAPSFLFAYRADWVKGR